MSDFNSIRLDILEKKCSSFCLQHTDSSEKELVTVKYPVFKVWYFRKLFSVDIQADSWNPLLEPLLV